MGESIDASLSEPVHPLIEKALTSKIPIAELIGFGIEELGGGRAVASLRSGPQHANPMGTLHGGVLCDLADAAMGMAFATTLAPDESFTTVRPEYQFLPACLADGSAGGRAGHQPRTERRLCRM